ncbi:hypothetical protein AV530_002883 [Patagioenas fasciata monilis]|uniref:Uncharacterized protein n=1 Tax=Patagioenas fasciata monilis TaxID=372326 RepID=A0A1V4K9H9_PATFA|nr:hypothetical protein AV530_002883 [Patagioenas fasciata monilis]
MPGAVVLPAGGALEARFSLRVARCPPGAVVPALRSAAGLRARPGAAGLAGAVRVAIPGTRLPLLGCRNWCSTGCNPRAAPDQPPRAEQVELGHGRQSPPAMVVLLQRLVTVNIEVHSLLQSGEGRHSWSLPALPARPPVNIIIIKAN